MISEMVCARGDELHTSHQKMNHFLCHSIAKPNKKQNGFTLIELIVTVSILGILSLIAVPSFNDSRDRAKSSNAKQFVVDAAKDCSIALINEDISPVVAQVDAGSDVILSTYSCIKEGSVVADGGKDRWTVVLDKDGIPEFPIKSTISSVQKIDQ